MCRSTNEAAKCRGIIAAGIKDHGVREAYGRDGWLALLGGKVVRPRVDAKKRVDDCMVIVDEVPDPEGSRDLLEAEIVEHRYPARPDIEAEFFAARDRLARCCSERETPDGSSFHVCRQSRRTKY